MVTKVKTLAEMREEIKAKNDELHRIFNDHPEISEMPPDVAEKIKPLNDEITDLSVEYEKALEVDNMRTAAAERERKFRTPANVPPTPGPKGDDGGHAEPKQRSIKSIIAASEDYAEFQKSRKGTVVFDLTEAETKTLLTLTDYNVQATRQPGVPVLKPVETATVRDMMLSGTIDGNTMEYYEETTFTNNAAEVAEGGTKPESALAFTLRTDNVRKIATWIPATDELLADASLLRSYIEGRLGFMVKRREEAELLVGDGIAPNIRGILNRSGIQTQAKGADPTPDAIYKAMTLINVNAFEDPSGVVMHPLDWQDIRLLRTADGIYIWGSPSEAGPERIWGLPVRKTTAITQNTALVGDFRQAQVFEREGITITVSTEHSTYFVENKVAILAEERILLAVYKAIAFCTVTGI